jgi:hypothetical protein
MLHAPRALVLIGALSGAFGVANVALAQERATAETVHVRAPRPAPHPQFFPNDPQADANGVMPNGIVANSNVYG